ncbi:serine/threonine-protein kinase meng-po isoform X1 [Drosophila kikkawai]|uniref:Serine/threonine-protein kinase SAPK4 isoform X1 n=1 Tax=Drosophila kikkawai TaxID=30033 RepID=A0A6P4IQM8_DROKI|nr:serine/threonine-protein kinase meng-po isoform X1 [Drosophila kikkawai]XP_017024804.1 serine/threonine-protein kinase meng-po isoform X1 [Drosophila kikkawai]XP_017024805.1 serine/threonine-protein kinase meng-po isoform X1 [Drosophila kikkawai]XP_017024806.1 serine/threonine-protein kinase meng-po isoform X1 [Drosophila kikkawai]XP_041632689.1 serine/threonine-protein kinase meng-po isoform X1 [Drosophila kikkawai]
MSKKPRGHIHKIREFELEKIQLVDEFDIIQIVGEGWFGKILLVEHRGSQTEMVLKAVPKPYVTLRDFYREFHYGLHLGVHRHIVTTYDVAFETAGFYVFTQEYAPLGDLTSNVTDSGVGEVYSKRVAKQLASAIDYMHSKDIVHRDIKLDNVLIYRSDFQRIKLCDFGESFPTGSTVERRNEWLPYSPPEVLEIKPEGSYKADPSHDVWQFGIVIFVCLTGCLPWQKAASDDPRYVRYLAWQGGLMMMPLRRTPRLFKLLTSNAQRMFKRFFARISNRPKSLADVTKFLDDRWLAKTAQKEMAEYETDELCPSMYSFHSSPDEKNRLLYTLADCGIETNVDRQQKKNRIKDWIESSIITEEDEEENEETNSASPSSSVSREPLPGHISSLRKPASPPESSKEIKGTLKDATQKHFDPRTGALQQGPSEMGQVAMSYSKSASPSSNYSTTASTLNNADSLLTLGSRQDLLASNMTMYTSMETELNRLGEADPRLNQRSLSSNPMLTTFDVNTSPAAKNSIGVGTRNSSRSILKSSIVTAAYPALGAFNMGQSHSLQQLNQHLQTSTGLNPKDNSFFSR